MNEKYGTNVHCHRLIYSNRGNRKHSKSTINYFRARVRRVATAGVAFLTGVFLGVAFAAARPRVLFDGVTATTTRSESSEPASVATRPDFVGVFALAAERAAPRLAREDLTGVPSTTETSFAACRGRRDAATFLGFGVAFLTGVFLGVAFAA